MPPDQNSTQNPIPEENPLPVSPQEPTEPAPENTAYSEPANMPSEAPESPREGVDAVPVNNANEVENEPEAISPQSGEAPEMPENQGSSSSKPETAQMGRNEPLGESSRTQNQTSQNPVREILAKAQLAIQNKKRKKLDSILTLFAKRTSITNDEVEKFLRVSDATATRYLSILEKENKIKQVGKTGKGVSYSRI